MLRNQIHLLATRRFLPLFLVQFLGAFNDNVFKNAFVILLTFRLAAEMGWKPELCVSVVAGVFILPFFLFSALAGQLADKLEKSRLIRWIKLAEIVAMSLAAYGFVRHEPYFLFVTLFLMGSHSAFFGPLKYSILPNHLQADELVAGNALIEAGTYLAILVGTMLGGLTILQPLGPQLTSVLVVGIAVAGWLASWAVPQARAQVPDLRINANFLAETWNLIAYSKTQTGVYRCQLGISWFWLVGSVWLTLIPAFVEHYLHGTEDLVTTLLTLFAVGIGVGSLLCNRLMHGELSARWVPPAGVLLSLFTFDFVGASRGLEGGNFQALSWTGLHLAGDVLGIAVAAGVFSVPLYALMQAWSDPAHCSRNVASCNVLNALAMVLGSLAMTGLFALKCSILQVLVGVAVLNMAVSAYIVMLVPDSRIRAFVEKVCHR